MARGLANSNSSHSLLYSTAFMMYVGTSELALRKIGALMLDLMGSNFSKFVLNGLSGTSSLFWACSLSGSSADILPIEPAEKRQSNAELSCSNTVVRRIADDGRSQIGSRHARIAAEVVRIRVVRRQP
jgi:hypothetical protein